MYRKWIIIGCIFLLLISLGYNAVQFKSIGLNTSVQHQSIEDLSKEIYKLSEEIEWYGQNGTEEEIDNFIFNTSMVFGMGKSTRHWLKDTMLDEAMLNLSKLLMNSSPEEIKEKSGEIASVLLDISNDMGNIGHSIELINIIKR